MKNLTKTLLVLVYLLAAAQPTWAHQKPLNIRFIKYADVSEKDKSYAVEGVNYFSELLDKHCGLKPEIQYDFTDQEQPSPSFEFQGWFHKEKVFEAADYWFRFFQFSTFRASLNFSNQSDPADVRIYLVNRLPGHCGFAFPMIQFNEESARQLNAKSNQTVMIESKIKNSVLFASPEANSGDCSNFKRFMSHELAHIFVQDQTPHHCLNETTQKYEPCPDNNLLSTYRKIYPSPNRRFPSNPGFEPAPGGEALSPDEPIIVKPWGTDLDRHQCLMIMNTLKEMN